VGSTATLVMIREQIGKATLYCGDSNEILDIVDAVDSCVTDPPYGLSFMGKQWDYDVPTQELWERVFQSIKQGGHLLSFFGSRTYHRGVIPIEDAGFEIRDQLMWIYGSGFPKSHNIGKAVDKLQGNEREVLETKIKKAGDITGGNFKREGSYPDKQIDITKGTSKYEGWGTALKPAHEPIVMARKPFKGSVAENVLEHGTGGINIDECRVKVDSVLDQSQLRTMKRNIREVDDGWGMSTLSKSNPTVVREDGRFPANVMHDGSEEVLEIFPQTSKSSGGRSYQNTNQMYSGGWADEKGKKIDPGFGDEGTAARYFYCAKASKKDRDEGLDEFTDKNLYVGKDRRKPLLNISENRNKSVKNTHPTVKPTELMRYLCRLVTPKGGVVLDPFMGSGSTGKGALLEGFKFVGIEMEREYFDIACARLEAVQNNMQGDMFD
jgi:DNA modification methylase